MILCTVCAIFPRIKRDFVFFSHFFDAVHFSFNSEKKELFNKKSFFLTEFSWFVRFSVHDDYDCMVSDLIRLPRSQQHMYVY